MRFKGLDLNLLTAFAVLMEERSVSAAARRLNLSQPAASAALRRLRTHFGDELLVAHGRRMFPSALAEALTPRIAEALASIGSIIDTVGAFDASTSTRTFRIAASDYILMILIRPLMRRLADIAPHVRLVIEPPGERTVARLDEGRIDLFVTPEEFASPHHPAVFLIDERHVVVGWDRNPAFAPGISESAFFAAEHVGVLLGTDSPAAFADRHLEQLGMPRRIAATVPSFAAVPWMVVGTSRIALMHERLAEAMRRHLPIATSAMPLAFPAMREVVQYHRARDGDPGLLWLRGQLAEMAEADWTA